MGSIWIVLIIILVLTYVAVKLLDYKDRDIDENEMEESEENTCNCEGICVECKCGIKHRGLSNISALIRYSDSGVFNLTHTPVKELMVGDEIYVDESWTNIKDRHGRYKVLFVDVLEFPPLVELERIDYKQTQQYRDLVSCLGKDNLCKMMNIHLSDGLSEEEAFKKLLPILGD